MGGAESERERALARAVQALARRDHSAQSIRAKLERAGLSEQAQDDAVETLAGAGYLDDERFASDRAALLAQRGYGDERIRADLDSQGVTGPSIDRALSALEPELDRAVQVARGFRGDVRALRMLERRGFSEEAVEGVAAARLRANGEEE